MGVVGNPSTTNLMLYSTILALAMVATSTATLAEITPPSLDHYFETLSQKKGETLTKLQVYIQAYFDTSSPNQTVFQVASADITPQSSSRFGWVIDIDNPLTVGLDPGSQNLGHYQGMNAYSDFNVPAATMSMNMVFAGGDHDGSTVSILGRQPVSEELRVMSIIGGTGSFRMAKGTVLASTYSLDSQAQSGVYVYVMYILTPSVGSVQPA